MKKIQIVTLAIGVIAIGVGFFTFQSTAETPPPPNPPTPPGEDFPPYTPGTPFRLFGGSVDGGKKAFEQLNCIQCHKVKGVQVAEPKGKRRLLLTLGQEVRFVKRYEDLILAITNPRHVINEQYRSILTQAELNGGIEPMMPDLTDHMTARQLVDLVAFLNSAYSDSQPGFVNPDRED
ncbi:MAG: c-type cytochrome [Verrucomicrobiales bacterium]|nr:c-type cytochrome [Verrucomicrobiales bacterium]